MKVLVKIPVLKPVIVLKMVDLGMILLVLVMVMVMVIEMLISMERVLNLQ